MRIDAEKLSFRELHWRSQNKPLHREFSTRTKEVAAIFEESKFLGLVVGLGMVQEFANTIPSKFAGFFVCDECGQDVAVVGTAKRITGKSAVNRSPMLKVEYFSPPTPMFEIDPATPQAITEEIVQAFSHFHSDLNASGAKVRRAMEKICETLVCQEKTLHASIMAMARDYPKEAGWLSVLKLPGNEAVHSDRVDEEDLLTAFEVLSAVLDIFRRKARDAAIENALPSIGQKFARIDAPK